MPKPQNYKSFGVGHEPTAVLEHYPLMDIQGGDEGDFFKNHASLPTFDKHRVSVNSLFYIVFQARPGLCFL